MISIFLALSLLGDVSLAAETPGNAQKLLEKTDTFRGRDDGLYMINRILDVTKDGKEVSELEVKIKNENARVTYLAPANSRGDVVLMVGPRVWIFRRGVKRPLPLTPRQRLLGNALVGDILNTRYSDDYKAVSMKRGSYGERDVFILELKPRKRGVTYDRIRYFIDSQSSRGIHAEFYALTGKMLKTADFYYHTVNLGEGPQTFIQKTVIQDPVIESNKTIVSYLRAHYRSFSSSIFNRSMIGN